MTIGGWIFFIVVAVVIILIAIAVFRWLKDESTYSIGPKEQRSKIVYLPLMIGFGLVVVIFFGMLFYYNRTEPGRRAFHTQESELTGGLNRTVRIYDVQGDLIEEYSGRFDIEYDEERIVFDDELGHRHIIYFSVSTVIIDEE